MQRHKSQRHVNAANARWRAAEQRAQAERDDGIPDRPSIEDARQPFPLALSAFGWVDVIVEPRLGYVAWRVLDAQTREVLHCAASKELMRWIAAQLPRLMGARNFH